ncbi:MAG: UDP-2,4-diacetamido-2,4,6-trideoxy-beta-L-altropyranose hydrolase [Planctomycetes bacterium]|nr:UDP-2,4-diacetamido-2,4,6-trideoxy-beta-L-altropyranose hydrolase [Planctomycetota bacterium]
MEISDLTSPGRLRRGTLVVRADADPGLGIGHVMRGLALAQGWRRRGGEAVFLGRMPEGCSSRLAGFPLVPLGAVSPDPVDLRRTLELGHSAGPGCWVLVDGQHLDLSYQRRLRESGLCVLVADDRHDSPVCDADVIVNPSAFGFDPGYQCPTGTAVCLGPRYALLREEFLSRTRSERTASQRSRVLVTLGGADSRNATNTVLQALQALDAPVLQAKIVVGPANPRSEVYRRLVAGRALEVLDSPPDMAELLAWADLAVILAGGTLWEGLAIGCPLVSLSLHPIQRRVLDELERHGCVVHAGPVGEVGAADLSRVLAATLGDTSRCARLAANGRRLVDGLGVERVLDAIDARDRGPDGADAGEVRLQPLTREMVLRTWDWVCDPELQRDFMMSAPPTTLQSHIAYFEAQRAAPDRLVFGILAGSEHVGNAGLKNILPRVEAELWLYIGRSPLRGRGLGSRATRLLLDHAYGSLGVANVVLHVSAANAAALAMYGKLGFRRTPLRAGGPWAERGESVWRMERPR